LTLDLVVGDYYSLSSLEVGDGLCLLRYTGDYGLFLDECLVAHYFKVVPFKQLKLNFLYEKSLGVSTDEFWSVYDIEEDDLRNCFGKYRLGAFD